jgi:hypothetical protein
VFEREPWSVAGDYLEACNCDAVCPCRRIDGVPGGRSTYGECMGVLSWAIRSGSVGPLDLSGLAVGLVCRYRDDEEGSPWTFALYVDEQGSADQLRALEAIFLGRLGGPTLEQFPWVRKPSTLVGVRPARIEVEHSETRRWFRVHGVASIRIAGPVEDDATVTCVIPGHHRSGQELIAERLEAKAGPLAFEFSGRCAYASTFDYSGPGRELPASEA